MTTPEQQPHQPDVSTEPQRQALDEMSRQLVERLNDMVREQRARVERFAATQHSLSSLPGLPELPEAPPLLPEPEEVPPPQPEAETSTQPRAPRVKKFSIPLPRAARPKKPQDFDTAPAPKRPSWLDKLPHASRKEGSQSESGCGTIPTLVAIIIFIILARSCS